RLINASSTYAFNVGFDNHPMQVIAADGKPVEPIVVDVLPMEIGDRYDDRINADKSGSHWIHVDNFNGKGGRAILEYEDAGGAEPSETASDEDLKTMKLDELKSVDSVNLPKEEANEVRLVLGGQMRPYEWKI